MNWIQTGRTLVKSITCRMSCPRALLKLNRPDNRKRFTRPWEYRSTTLQGHLFKMVGVTGFEPALSSPQTRSETSYRLHSDKNQSQRLDAYPISHKIGLKVCCKHLKPRLVLCFLLNRKSLNFAVWPFFVCLFQLTHLAEMRHKEHDHHYAVVVSTFIIWSKFNVFQPYCRKIFQL